MKNEEQKMEALLIAFADHLMNIYTITENYKITHVDHMIDGYNPENISEKRLEQKISFEFSATKPTRSKLINDIRIFVATLELDKID